MVARIGLIVVGAIIFSLFLNIPLILFEVPSSGATLYINAVLFITGGLAGNRLYDMQNGLPVSNKPPSHRRAKRTLPTEGSERLYWYQRSKHGFLPSWYRKPKPKDPPTRRGR